MTEALHHRLAAILAADVASYSRLMAADARATVSALDAARHVFRTHIESRRGRVIDMAGDSVLATFDTAAGAVGAAVAIQKELAGTASKMPSERRMEFRIGVHLGDIIEKPDGTVYGDGVNIAARLESLAAPNGICVSDSIRIAVKGKVEVAFVDQGEQAVKNIPDPVRVYRVEWDTLVNVEMPALAHKPSIAVLPFTNMSGDPEQEFFADGISEDIITELSRISGLLVIARNSTFVFKNQAVDIKEIGRRFGVRHVLEGSVRKAGVRVRVTAQLIDASTSGHVWAEKFDRDLVDIFAVQDEITQSIAGTLKIKLTEAERVAFGQQRVKKVNIEAYDLVARARSCLYSYTRAGAVEGRALCERALKADPTYASVYAVLGALHGLEYVSGWNPTRDHLELSRQHSHKAVELDPDDAEAHHVLGMLMLWHKDYELAERHARTAIEVQPGYASGYEGYGQVLDFTNRHTAAMSAFQCAARLDPNNHLVVHLLGRAQLGAGLVDEAAASFIERIARHPNTDMSRLYLASIYASRGRLDEARALYEEIKMINPSFSLSRLRKVLPYRDDTWFERLIGPIRAVAAID